MRTSWTERLISSSPHPLRSSSADEKVQSRSGFRPLVEWFATLGVVSPVKVKRSVTLPMDPLLFAQQSSANDEAGSDYNNQQDRHEPRISAISLTTVGARPIEVRGPSCSCRFDPDQPPFVKPQIKALIVDPLGS
jgi:hypothetical protein